MFSILLSKRIWLWNIYKCCYLFIYIFIIAVIYKMYLQTFNSPMKIYRHNENRIYVNHPGREFNDEISDYAYRGVSTVMCRVPKFRSFEKRVCTTRFPRHRWRVVDKHRRGPNDGSVVTCCENNSREQITFQLTGNAGRDNGIRRYLRRIGFCVLTRIRPRGRKCLYECMPKACPKNEQ